PLQSLLDNPTLNPEGLFTHSYKQLIGLVTTQYLAVGEAYLIVIQDGADIPRQLQIATPGTIEPQLTKGVISGYRVFGTQRGPDRILRPQDVIRFWEPDPYDLYESRGVTRKSQDIIETDLFAIKRWRNFYQNDATPKLAFVAKDGGNAEFPSIEEQGEVSGTWQRLYNRLTGRRNLTPAWVHPDWNIEQLSSEEEAASGVAMMTHTRRKVFEQYGVSTAAVGDVVDVNRAAAETTRYTMDVNTIEPITELEADAFTTQLANQYPSPNDNVQLVVKFQPFIMRDKAFELQRDQIDAQIKVRSLNEIRTQREPALDPASWGDFPVGGLADTPYTGEEEELDLSGFTLEETSEEPEEVTAIEEGEEVTEPRARVRSLKGLRAHFSAEREWMRVVQRDERFTPKFRDVQRSVFKRQGEISLERFLKAGRVRAPADDLVADIFPLNGWQTLFEQTTEVVREASFVASASEATDAITSQRFVMTEAARGVLTEMDLTHYVFVNTTTQDALRVELSAGLAAGESTDQISARIVNTFSTRRKQATRIARTEIASAVQTAQIEGYKQTGVVEKKMWNTSLDGDVRDSHIIEGQTRDLDEPFSLGNGAIANGPADPALSAGDRINCRCFVTPVFTDEELLGIL
ncbi:MAG: phage portal protein, partial [Gammaproteobacteria bacterium]